MGSSGIFTEVTAIVAEDFLTRYKQTSELNNLKESLWREVPILSFRNIEEILQIRGDLEGINKSLLVLKAIENSLPPLDTSNCDFSKTYNTEHEGLNILQEANSRHINDSSSSVTSYSIHKTSHLNHQYSEKVNNNVYAEHLFNKSFIPSHSDKQDDYSRNSGKELEECITSNNATNTQDANKLEDTEFIRNGDMKESTNQFSSDLDSIIQCEPDSINCYNHDDPVENLLECLSVTENKTSSPKNILDYSTWSFQKADENTFIATEELFDYSSMCLSDMYESEVNEKSVIHLQQRKGVPHASENVKLNVTETIQRTEKINQNVTNTIASKLIKLRKHKDPAKIQYNYNTIVRKEELDRLDKMIESINKNQSKVHDNKSDECGDEYNEVDYDKNYCVEIARLSKSAVQNFDMTNSENVDSPGNNRTSKSDTENGDEVCSRLDNVHIQVNEHIKTGDSIGSLKKKVNSLGTNELTKDKPVKGIGTSRIKCLHCCKWFKMGSSLKKHMSAVHSGVRFQCKFTECKKYFTSEQAIKIHTNCEHRKLQCPRCKVIFDSQEEKDKHNKFCGTPTCHICGKKYSSISNLNKHEKLHDKSNRVECQLCKKWYCSRTALKDHKETIHKVFECIHCGNNLLTKQELQSHITTVHPKVAKAFYKKTMDSQTKQLKRSPAKCPHCSKTFASQSNLGYHLRNVHERNKINCVDCGKTFSRRDHLQRHQKIAHEKLDYPCPFCSIAYPNRATLAKHQKAEHKQLMLDQCYQCETCGQTFLYQCNLERHIKRDHKGVRFGCPKCECQFQSKYRREEHILVVHEGKRWSCEHCTEVFKNKSKLKYHIKNKHTKAGPCTFTCNICKNSFINKSKLAHHKANNHCRDAIIVKANVRNVLLDESSSLPKIEENVQTCDKDDLNRSVYTEENALTNVIQAININNVSSIKLDTNASNCSAGDRSEDTSLSEMPTDILKSALETHGIGPNSVFDSFEPVHPVDFHSAFNISHNLQSPQQVPSQPVPIPPVGIMYKDVSDYSKNSIYASFISAENKKNCNLSPAAQYSQVLNQITNSDFMM